MADLDLFEETSIDVASVRKNIRHLAEGSADAVVTGQQPGLGGGPLYVLYKIATTIELALIRSENGRPSVPVFWLGDDDDDLTEALDPELINPITHSMVSQKPETAKRNIRSDMIGTFRATELEKPVLDLLDEFVTRECSTDKLGQDIQKLYLKAEKQGISFSALNENLIRRFFPDSGLVILRGNDPRLHQSCENFYKKVIPVLPQVVQGVEAESSVMEGEWGVVPLSPNSLKRPLYEVKNNQRVPLIDFDSLPDVSALRCGVLLRSLLQDFFLTPAAVVVGPGELSYLSQLRPAYEFLGIKRAPLIPRLFSSVIPLDFDELIPEEIDRSTIEDRTRKITSVGQKKLIEILEKEFSVSGKRAAELAEKRTRRWTKGLNSLLENEAKNFVQRKTQFWPGWVLPGGKRQERTLAWVPCVLAWGENFCHSLQQAARLHLEGGLKGQWSEILIRIDSDFENDLDHGKAKQHD
ncbi:MAG: bacillithiol biosynthesis BshC [bacterium]|nr:bacillithiol biosynthesis BshC [bacterium]